ncbi:MAG: N-acetylmuramoyl-L-alanine amidase [Vicinamibacterales bacterium]
MTFKPRVSACLAGALLLMLAWPAAAQSRAGAQANYQRLLARERTLAEPSRSTPKQVRNLIAAYEHFAGRYARTGYADNALWQAAQLAASLHLQTRSTSDMATAKRIMQFLVKAYPSSSLLPSVRTALRDLNKPVTTARAKPQPAPGRSTPGAPVKSPEITAPPLLASTPAMPALPAATSTAVPLPPSAMAILSDVRRSVLPDIVRLTFELSREVHFRDQRASGPDRVDLDLDATNLSPLVQMPMAFEDDVVRRVQMNPGEDQTSRVSIELDGASRYSLFTLYNPFRLVVDIYRAPKEAGSATERPGAASRPPAEAVTAVAAAIPARQVPMARGVARLATPTDSRPVSEAEAEPASVPVAPAANASGSFSISRQLGLGVSRIVIDPGHGGHDPGALGPRVKEAELVLDVALRVEKLLRKIPGLEVALTRRTDTFVPLEERTAIANRFGADLFLSIHANASRNSAARGIETYFLNFASSADAAAVAARENAASSRSMHQLTDIVKAIALNNKLAESRELAHAVQTSLVKAVRAGDKGVRDLGVKQAPFVVLVGASMPSVLAEISFITNPTDAQRLRSATSRQRIAESLADALVKYQRALKATETAWLQ